MCKKTLLDVCELLQEVESRYEYEISCVIDAVNWLEEKENTGDIHNILAAKEAVKFNLKRLADKIGE